ncbi:phosphate ABC transporter permease subunit PstC [Aminithiophilus ramosus]|uniref:Phosphate transport system permease protein n=2 Tax=Synergistales TaxID=649776 RepID=A0A9Q7EVV8_9BACT|nr:phosphate ABC transporter permease subunit PstC [Aminithiophilus ramosus]QTX32304.1 phosphate ABC transporter permease subunit PstC [Aminithiophilus ramosus]QVL36170.1 phosphate ABC transporter permease subunit PstC [Synergistota bacterium]
MKDRSALKADRLPKALIAVVATSGLAVMLFILYFLFRESLPALRETTLGALLSGEFWYPTAEPAEFGLLALIAGSLAVTFLASALSVPVSLGLAVFLSEICPRGLREVFKPLLEILGFFPSVVLGFLGMVVLAPWLQERFTLLTGLNLLNASLLMGVMILPIVTSLAEDALASVPRDLRDASYALGATRLETTWRVVLPAALPSILQAGLLGVMRAIGETMVVLMASGGAAVIPRSLMDPVRPLTSTIAAEMGETPIGSTHYHVLFFAGLLLLAMTLSINLCALWIERQGRRWRA